MKSDTMNRAQPFVPVMEHKPDRIDVALMHTFITLVGQEKNRPVRIQVTDGPVHAVS